MQPIEFKGRKFDTYELKLHKNEIVISCYLRGSVSGGTGTECSHTITGKNIAKFLAKMELRNVTGLHKEVKNYTEKNWRKLHTSIMEYQTSSWSWSETNWND